MTPLLVYHNPRCRKSREAVQWLTEHGIPFEEYRYLERPLSAEQIEKLLDKLVDPIEAVIRTNEKAYKEHYKGLPLTRANIIKMLTEHPRLMQRPIVASPKAAVIARPADKIQTLLDHA